MILLKQSTARTVKIGPFVDSTDGNTDETGLTIAYTDVLLSKNGGAYAAKNETTGCTHDALGMYGCPLDTTDTGTLGSLQLIVHVSGALSVPIDFMVVTANVYDTLCSTDLFNVNVTHIADTAQTANDNGADINSLIDRLTATRAGYLDELGPTNIPADIDTLISRLTAARAGYIDELSSANIPSDIDTLIARITATRAGYLDELGATNIPADIDALLARLTSARAGYLDELSSANIPTDIDTLLTRIVGTLTAGNHNPQSGDSYSRIGAAGAGLTNISLPATGLDAVLKTSDFALAIADAVLDEIVEGTTTGRQILRGLFSVLCLKAAGDGANFRDLADAKNRVSFTFDGSGNRTAVTLDLT